MAKEIKEVRQTPPYLSQSMEFTESQLAQLQQFLSTQKTTLEACTQQIEAQKSQMKDSKERQKQKLLEILQTVQMALKDIARNKTPQNQALVNKLN